MSSTEAPKVFITHSWSDIDFSRCLRDDLTSHGYEVWFDESTIRAGQRMAEQINDGLEWCDIYLPILSPDSLASSWCKEEIYAAIALSHKKGRDGRPGIVPVLAKDCEVPVLISSRLYINMAEHYEIEITKVYAAIDAFILERKNTYWAEARKTIAQKKDQIPVMRFNYQVGKLLEEKEIGPTKMGTKGLMYVYENALVIWHDNGNLKGNAYATYGAIMWRYRSLGGWQALGFPIVDESEAAPSPYEYKKGMNGRGRYSSFELGEIVWCDGGEYNGQTFVIKDPIRKVYDSLGGSGKFLGFPISEPYRYLESERCDFEGGTILLQPEKEIQVVRQLLRLDYSDSPFEHQWSQYKPDSKEDRNTVSIRHGHIIGGYKSYVAFNIPDGGRGIQFPSSEYKSDKVEGIKYCGITVKSLESGGRIRLYVMQKTNATKPQCLEVDSEHPTNKLREEKWADYWRLQIQSPINDGNWHTLIFDLERLTQEGFKKNLESLLCFRFSERMGISDIIASESKEAIAIISVNPVLL